MVLLRRMPKPCSYDPSPYFWVQGAGLKVGQCTPSRSLLVEAPNWLKSSCCRYPAALYKAPVVEGLSLGAMDMSGANAIAYAPAANCEDEAEPIKDPNIGAFIARATIGA